jgi:hypothetical protein
VHVLYGVRHDQLRILGQAGSVGCVFFGMDVGRRASVSAEFPTILFRHDTSTSRRRARLCPTI